MFHQLRGILARAQQCAKGHDVDGVQSALVEAELELNAVETAVAQADAESADDPASVVDETLGDDAGGIRYPEPEPERIYGMENVAEPGTEEQADGASEPPPPQVFQ